MLELIEYNKQLWDRRFFAFSTEFKKLMKLKNKVILLNKGSNPIVVGAPHHTMGGEMYEGRPGEAYIGFFLAYIVDIMGSKGVIAVHVTDHDPNKDSGSLYCRTIFNQNPNMLVEIHRCKFERKNDVEITSGQNKLAQPVLFAKELRKALQQTANDLLQSKSRYEEMIGKELHDLRISAQLKPSSTEGVELSALSTASLTEAGAKGIPAYHIEIKVVSRKLHKRRGPILTKKRKYLTNAIADTIQRSYAYHEKKRGSEDET